MNKFKTYTKEYFIDSTITLNEIDKNSAVWKQLEAILTKYDFHWFHDEWCVHEGDLEIDHSFLLKTDLIVTGNLIVKGDYLDEYDSALIVLGNMNAENIISEQRIYVKGDVKATGLILCHYNDNVGEFCGKVTAKLFCVAERYFIISGELLCPFRDGESDEPLTIEDVTPFVEEVFEVDEYQELEEEEVEVEVSFNSTLIGKYLKQGKSIYK